MPWRRMARRLCKEYGYTIQQVGDMTLYQIRTLLGPEWQQGPGILRGLSPAEVSWLQEQWRVSREIRGF